jgi:type VI secretion system protein ImpL
VLRQLVREQAWVLGSAEAAATDAAATKALADDVQRLYLDDYGTRWQQFIGDLRLAPATTLAGSAELANLLARADSPLLALLRAAVREVSIDTSPQSWGERFDALRQYLGGQPAPIEATQSLLAKLSAHLAAVDDAVKRKSLPPASEVLNELAAAAQRAPEPVRGMLTQLSTSSASLVFASMREPLSRQVASEIAAQCGRVVTAHYPMLRTGTQEMSREEFTRTFGAGGLFDSFFQRHLLPYVDTAAQPWALRGAEGAARAEAGESLQQFQRAQAIRDAFFRDGGRRLGVRLEFRPLEFDPGIGEFTLDVDGQVLRFRPGVQAIQSLQWPGPGDSGRVHLQVTPIAGAGGPGYTFQGPWALFRLLDRVRTEAGSAPDRSVLVFDVEGRKARFEVRSPAALNPMSRQLLEHFKCPGRL